MTLATRRSTLNEGFETGEGVVPLRRDALEVRPHVSERIGLEREQFLAARADIRHQLRTLKHAQMFGDGLTGQRRAFGKLRDRQGSPPASLATSDRRVSSPSAAKIVARASISRRLGCALDMVFDVVHFYLPTIVVHAIGLELTVFGNGVEAGLGDGEEGASAFRLEFELDKRLGLRRIVDLRIDGIRVPGKGKITSGSIDLTVASHLTCS